MFDIICTYICLLKKHEGHDFYLLIYNLFHICTCVVVAKLEEKTFFFDVVLFLKYSTTFEGMSVGGRIQRKYVFECDRTIW